MKNKYISPFKPKKIKDVKTPKIKIYTFKAGYKRSKDDLLIIVFEKPVKFAAVFTKSSTPSAPVIWDRKLNKKKYYKISDKEFKKRFPKNYYTFIRGQKCNR